MDVTIREYTREDIPEMERIWNKVVVDGIYYPPTEPMTREEAEAFFKNQSYTAVACLDEAVVGLYILHPNSFGRCAHVSNASYAVSDEARNKHIGEKLVLHSLAIAKELGFRLLQFNAVVKSNQSAIHLYDKLGFVRIGEVPGAFLLKNGQYDDLVLFYYQL